MLEVYEIVDVLSSSSIRVKIKEHHSFGNTSSIETHQFGISVLNGTYIDFTGTRHNKVGRYYLPNTLVNKIYKLMGKKGIGAKYE